MADNKRKIGKPDRDRVAGGEDYEVAYVAKKKGVSRSTVRKATKKAGPMRKAVEAVIDTISSVLAPTPVTKGRGKKATAKKASARKKTAAAKKAPAKKAPAATQVTAKKAAPAAKKATKKTAAKKSAAKKTSKR